MPAMALPGHESEPKQIVGTQLRKTLNTIPAYTWYAVPSGTLTFVNEAYADYLGLAKDDPLRLGLETGVAWDTHIELVHPDDREETLRVGATCNRTGAAGQTAFRIRNSEGEYRWFLSRLEPLRASDGTLLYWIGINLDIEELKRAEEQRRIAGAPCLSQDFAKTRVRLSTSVIRELFGDLMPCTLLTQRLPYFEVNGDSCRLWPPS